MASTNTNFSRSTPMNEFEYWIQHTIKGVFSLLYPTKKFLTGNTEGLYISGYQFYLTNYTDNIYKPMNLCALNSYAQGSGNELEDKMRSVRSSSAMTYNLFANDCAVIKSLCQKNPSIPDGIYTVEYEKQLPTLNLPLAPKANLDAFLVKEDIDGYTIIACEMKMCEWLTNHKYELKEAYISDPENYFNPQTAETFINVGQKIVTGNFERSYITTDEGDTITDYLFKPSKLETYDAPQMFKHSLACYNFCREFKKNHAYKPIKQFILANVIWELPESFDFSYTSVKNKNKYLSLLQQQHKEFKIFYEAMEPIITLFSSELNIDFDIQYYSIHEFIRMLELSEEHRNYLRRYTFG